MTVVSVEFFRTLFDYAYWGRDRILAAAEALTEAEFTRPCGLDYGSIRATLAHQLGSEVMLLNRWQGAAGRLTEEDVPTPDRLRAAWQEQEQRVREFLARLSDAEMERSVQYQTRSGATYSEILWQSMFQATNHATQHRSEVALALTQMGHSPGYLDFIAYGRERSG